MAMGLLFWILMLIWLVFGFFYQRVGPYGVYGHRVLLFVLLALLGWQSFGAPIQ